MAPKNNLKTVQHLDPLKTVPGERFWKNMKIRWKNYWKINGFWWSETIEKYWKTNTFLDIRSFTKTMKKRCQTGSQKSCFLVQIGDRGLPVSTYPQIFDVSVRCQKSIIFGSLPDGPKDRTNRALERQGPQKKARAAPRRWLWGSRVQGRLARGIIKQ